MSLPGTGPGCVFADINIGFKKDRWALFLEERIFEQLNAYKFTCINRAAIHQYKLKIKET